MRILNKSLAFPLVFLALVSACTLSPPPPPACLDDGRGLYPINGDMVTPEEVRLVNEKHNKAEDKTEASVPTKNQEQKKEATNGGNNE